MTYSCEAFLDYAYEGEVKIPLTVRIQNTITKLIEVIKKFILKVRSLKGERVVPKKALDAYRLLSKKCFNCINHCKKALQTGSPVSEIFREPFESPEYKILFSEDVKNRTSPGDYVKIQSSEVLGFMNGALTALSNAKQGLRIVNKDNNPNRAQAFTQIINYSKFMMKISNRVLSYKNMYVEKRHLPTTKVDETKAVNETYNEYEKECEVALELFGLFKKKPKVESTAEAKKLELDIRKKVLSHLKKMVKDDKLDQEYKNAICTYPSIKLVLSKNGVQITTAKYGTLEPKDWPPHIKNYYYSTRDYDGTVEKFSDEFDNRWYYDLINEGCSWCKDNCKVPNNFILQVWDGDSMENEIYIEVFEKIGEKASESFGQIVEEGIFSNIFNKKSNIDDAPIVEKKDIRDYPNINSAYSKIIHYIHAELYKSMSRSGATQWSVEDSGIWYANDHFCQCVFVQGYARDANFTKIIVNTKMKFSSLIKKYHIKIEKDEYQYYDAIFINAYI